jgi:plasmanylethanolamine desaturase
MGDDPGIHVDPEAARCASVTMAILRPVAFVIVGVLLADFLSGLAHWLEDSYFTPATPLLGHTIAKNVQHHFQPALFVANPWLVTIRSSLVCAILVGLSLWSVDGLGWWSGSGLGIAVFANQVHKWAHMPSASVPKMVRWLQGSGVLQTSEHHAVHHAGRKDSRYCVVTNVLNPVLDTVKLWRFLEWLILMVAAQQRRPDPSVQVS